MKKLIIFITLIAAVLTGTYFLKFDSKKNITSKNISTQQRPQRSIAQAQPAAQGDPQSRNANQVKSNCQPRDFRNRLPEIRDQDSVGWCFGFVAADLFSFREGQNFSAIDISINNYRSIFDEAVAERKNRPVPDWFNTPLSQLEGGHINIAANRAIADGVCLESNFNSADQNVVDLYRNLELELATLERYATQHQGLSATPQSCGKDCSTQEEVVSAAQRFAPGMSREEALEAAQTIAPNRLVEFYRNHTCNPRIPLNNVSTTSVRNPGRAEGTGAALAAIQEQLNNNNIVGIAYDPRFLRSPNIEYSQPDHASSIVGQRWNEKAGRCEFLLRNSWGRTCDYHKTFECARDANGNLDGHAWIPAELFNRHINEVTYLE